MICPMRHLAPVANLAAALTARNRNRYRRLMDIQPDERAILHMVSPPFVRLGTGPSGATLECRMPRERPPNQSAQAAIMGSKAIGVAVTLNTGAPGASRPDINPTLRSHS